MAKALVMHRLSVANNNMLKSFNGPLLFYFFNEPLLFYFLVVKAIELFEPLVVGRDVQNIFDDFANYWRELVNEDQIRWVREIFFYASLHLDKYAPLLL